MAHEVGHTLGFDHPDERSTENLEPTCTPRSRRDVSPRSDPHQMSTEFPPILARILAGTISESTCHTPYACSTLREYQTSQGSIMHSLTRHEPRTCLAETDMAGLHALYPTCNELIPTEISCVKATRLSGWLRLASVVGIPFLIAVVVIMVPLHFIRRRDQRKIKKLSDDVQASVNPSSASPTAFEACVELSRVPN